MMSLDIGLLVLRVVVGGLLAGHGAQKLFGWFGGYGFAGTSGFMGGMLRLRPAMFWTAVAGFSELGGGLSIALGFLTPFGASALAGAMLVAIVLAHWPKLWASENGFEYPLVLLAAAVMFGLGGAGAYSVDAALGIGIPSVPVFLTGLGFAVIGTFVAIAARAPAEPAAAARPLEDGQERPLAA